MLQGRVAIVTGAGGGIGRATALALARNGANLALNDLDPAACEEAASEVESYGTHALVLAGDVSAEDFAERGADDVAKRFGRIDILVNNAGVGGSGRDLIETEVADWDNVIAVNLRSQFLLCKSVGQTMRAQRQGVIINVASISGIHYSPSRLYRGDYAVSKAGVVMLTQVLAKELGPWGVRVNAVAPGATRTQLTKPLWEDADRLEAVRQAIPLRRTAEPSDVADVIVFLASDHARHISAETVRVTGGE